MTIPANAAAPFDCIVAAVPTLISLSNVLIPETNVPLKNVATPATCNVLAIDTLVGSKSPLTVSVDPSNVKFALSSNSPPVPARTTLSAVKS